MVLLTMTAAIVAAVEEYTAVPVKEASHPDEPSLTNPVVGNPISHGQILDVHKALNKLRIGSVDAAQAPPTLDGLLRGAQIYIPPPKPKAEPVCLLSHVIPL
jgi:hypothetical protein